MTILEILVRPVMRLVEVSMLRRMLAVEVAVERAMLTIAHRFLVGFAVLRVQIAMLDVMFLIEIRVRVVVLILEALVHRPVAVVVPTIVGRHGWHEGRQGQGRHHGHVS